MLETCAECGATGTSLLRCGRCRNAYYCNQEHQKAHWPTHKPSCQPSSAPKESKPHRVHVDAPDVITGPVNNPSSLFNKLMGTLGSMEGALDDEDEGEVLMSRFYDAFFAKNLHYACTYWQEHRENFTAFVERMLVDDTLAKLHANAVQLTQQFNAKYGWIPPPMMPHVQAVYDGLRAQTPYRATLLAAFEHFFGVIETNLDRLSPNVDTDALYEHRVTPLLTHMFVHAAAGGGGEPPVRDDGRCEQRADFLRRCLEAAGCTEAASPERTVVGDLQRIFWPQFVMFIVRWFDIYDSLLQGTTVDDRLAGAARQPAAASSAGDAAELAADGVRVTDPGAFVAQFATPEYWEKRYKAIPEEEPFFDWYAAWSPALSAAFATACVDGVLRARATLPSGGQPHVLVVGCGNSRMPIDMVEDGTCAKVWAVDRSAGAVEHCRARVPPELAERVHYDVASCDELPYKDATFDVVVEKAMVDTHVGASQSALLWCTGVLNEVHRILRPGGCFVSVSAATLEQRRAHFAVDPRLPHARTQPIDAGNKRYYMHVLVKEKEAVRLAK